MAKKVIFPQRILLSRSERLLTNFNTRWAGANFRRAVRRRAVPMRKIVFRPDSLSTARTDRVSRGPVFSVWRRDSARLPISLYYCFTPGPPAVS